MRNWPFSLQFRLIASFVLVLALTLSAVSWFVSTAFEAEAEQQQHEREDVRAARVQATFAAYFDAHGSWEGVEPVLEQASFLYGWRIVLSDNHGRVLGDSHGQEALRAGEEHEQKASESGEEHEPSSTVGMPVLSDGEKVGSLRFILDGPPSGESHEEPSESDLITRVNRSLIWTGLAVGGAGVLLIAFISRRVLLPIRSLSAAAVRFGKGDLSQRVAPATRDDVGQLGETFNAMAEELQRTELQRRNLMADIAHELRTPLANVQGYVEAIGDGILQADETTIETLHRQIAHLTGVVEDLRLLTLAEAGALPLYPQPHDTNDILAAAEAAFLPRAKSAGVTIEAHPSASPLTLLVDRNRVDQVIHNLVENAIRHTPPGGRVTLSTARASGMARITVADSGPGIPPEFLPRLFDRFYRADPSRARATGGVGLGLSIAKQLVEAHGGRLWAESTPGAGSRFIFELPLEETSVL